MNCQIYATQLGCFFEYEISDIMPAPNIGDSVAARDYTTGKKFVGTVASKQFMFIEGNIIINLINVWELK